MHRSLRPLAHASTRLQPLTQPAVVSLLSARRPLHSSSSLFFSSMPSTDQLAADIEALGSKIRQMKIDKADCTAEITELKALKAKLPKPEPSAGADAA